MVARFLTGIHPAPGVGVTPVGPGPGGRAVAAGLATAVLSSGIVVGFAIAAPIFVPLLYGKTFAQPLQVIALMGVLQALRFIRYWPTTIAIGSGRSVIVMLNNVARMVGLPIAILAHLRFATLEAVIGGFIVGELVALLVALALLAREGHVRLTLESRRVGLFLALCVMTVCAAWLLQDGKLAAGAVCVASGLVVALAIYLSERATFDRAWTLVRRRLKQGT